MKTQLTKSQMQRIAKAVETTNLESNYPIVKGYNIQLKGLHSKKMLISYLTKLEESRIEFVNNPKTNFNILD